MEDWQHVLEAKAKGTKPPVSQRRSVSVSSSAASSVPASSSASSTVRESGDDSDGLFLTADNSGFAEDDGDDEDEQSAPPSSSRYRQRSDTLMSTLELPGPVVPRRVADVSVSLHSRAAVAGVQQCDVY